jgi:general secretion pathway protein F
MPFYSYRAYGPKGELAEGRIEASSEQDVGKILWSQKLVPFEVKSSDQSETPWWKRDINVSSTSISKEHLARLTRELATLTAAGISLVDALRMLLDEAPSASMRSTLQLIVNDVLAGLALSDALAKHPKSFSAEYINVIRAAEVSGTHREALDELAKLLERRVELASRVGSALIYPMILILLSVVSLVLITGVLIPNIAPIFQGTGQETPATIAFLMFLHDHWFEIFLLASGLTLSATCILIYTLKNPVGRTAFDRWILGLPIYGPFLCKQETARFTRTFGTLMSAGVPLLQAGASASDTVKNQAFASSLFTALKQVREGGSLHSALKSETPLPPLALRMIAVGEQSAHLADMLVRVAHVFEDQTQRSLERFMTFLTPAITLFVAALVGLLIITIMNAVLSLNDIAIG